MVSIVIQKIFSSPALMSKHMIQHVSRWTSTSIQPPKIWTPRTATLQIAGYSMQSDGMFCQIPKKMHTHARIAQHSLRVAVSLSQATNVVYAQDHKTTKSQCILSCGSHMYNLHAFIRTSR